MSRLTGNDTKCLMEAYAAVYAPQELTEEQVWVEVENWVNSLLEEGYDLSDYTWEEMYESYVEEQVPSMKDMIRKGFERADTQAAYGRAAERLTGIKTPTPAFSRPASARPQQGLSGSIRTVPGRVPAPAAAARPAPAAPAAAARPAGAASSAPASSTAAKPAPSAPTSTSDSPSKQSTSSMVSDIRAMRARSLERQGKTGASAAVSATTKPAFKEENFDSFDVVIGHLLDEGYADTEESALAIMANMSEEWRNSIVEETLTEKLKKGTKGVQFGSGRHSGGWEQAMTEKNPKTGRQRATSPMYKAMGAHGKARSAQAKAESDGDFPRAEKNRQRREKIAATVYRKTGKIIDRADND